MNKVERIHLTNQYYLFNMQRKSGIQILNNKIKQI